MKALRWIAGLLVLGASALAGAQPVQVMDLPTRPGITERLGIVSVNEPKAVVLLLTGGDGRVGIADDGRIGRPGNFLVRSRERFAAQGLAVVLLDTPSDHGSPPFLTSEFRESAEHAADVGAAIAWAREKFGRPVWLVGTSRGTQSAAYVATVLAGAQAPDGIVLTATILARTRGETGRAVPEMDLAALKVPVLVVHHEEDPCVICPPARLPDLMAKLSAGLGTLKTYRGGQSRGPACEAFSYHGFNGIEDAVVADIAAWITAPR